MKKNNTNLEILFEDNHIIAVNKPCGELSQGDNTGDESMLLKVKEYIKEKYEKPGDVFLGLVHRLDRPTSGVLLFARTSKALVRINQMMQEKVDMKKIYWAVVDKIPVDLESELTHYIIKDSSTNKSKAHDKEVKGSKIAKLKYRYIGRTDKFHLLEIELITGRHHQIRAQLAKIGLHIKGDLKYGFPRSNADGKGIHLHAKRLEMMHPVLKKWIIIEAPLPKENLWNELKNIKPDNSSLK
jgi:23S rRNA pseudouridine1911/1915/1917 synthase